MILPLLNVGNVRAVVGNQLHGERLALVEPLRACLDAVFQRIELVPQNLTDSEQVNSHFRGFFLVNVV